MTLYYLFLDYDGVNFFFCLFTRAHIFSFLLFFLFSFCFLASPQSGGGGGGGPPNKPAPTPGGGKTTTFHSFAAIKSNASKAASDLKQNVNENLAARQAVKKKPGAKALYDFDPENSDELKLKAGDEIFDVVESEDDWMKGTTKDGKSGVFPSNYVEKL